MANQIDQDEEITITQDELDALKAEFFERGGQVEVVPPGKMKDSTVMTEEDIARSKRAVEAQLARGRTRKSELTPEIISRFSNGVSAWKIMKVLKCSRETINEVLREAGFDPSANSSKPGRRTS